MALLALLLSGCTSTPEEAVSSSDQNTTVTLTENDSLNDSSAEPAAQHVSPAMQGCAYDYPQCPGGYACVNNACVQQTAAEGCYYGDACDGFCFSNNCIAKSELLPDNSELSEGCGYNEVYANGSCIDAAFTINFVSNGLADEEFDRLSEEISGLLVYHTPLYKCPEKLRIHKTVLSESQCSYVQSEEDATVYLLDGLGMKNCTVSAARLAKIPLSESQTEAATALHELGHTLGLWDGYCYWPVPENPNPTDYEKGGCSPLNGNDTLFDYCSYAGRLPENSAPRDCIGNPNYFGGLTLMGKKRADPSRTYFSHPLFGFTKDEYEYIAQKISCN